MHRCYLGICKFTGSGLGFKSFTRGVHKKDCSIWEYLRIAALLENGKCHMSSVLWWLNQTRSDSSYKL